MIRQLGLLSVVLFCFVLVSQPVLSQEPGSKVYLPKGSVDGVALIGPPAKIGSPGFETQMAIVLWLQRTRTPEQVQFVREKLKFARFAQILGADLQEVDEEELRSMLAVIISEVRADYDAVKATYDLPRPFKVSDRVKPATDARPVGSYPSGHATRAMVYARILSDIFPDKKDALTGLGLQIGYGRVIAGVHYPMDVLAGQKLGNAYADVIIKGQAFKDSLKKIRGE